MCVARVCGWGVWWGLCTLAIKIQNSTAKGFSFLYIFQKKIVGPENLKDQGLNKDYKQFSIEG